MQLLVVGSIGSSLVDSSRTADFYPTIQMSRYARSMPLALAYEFSPRRVLITRLRELPACRWERDRKFAPEV